MKIFLNILLKKNFSHNLVLVQIYSVQLGNVHICRGTMNNYENVCGQSHDSQENHSPPILFLFFEQQRHCLLLLPWNSKDTLHIPSSLSKLFISFFNPFTYCLSIEQVHICCCWDIFVHSFNITYQWLCQFYFMDAPDDLAYRKKAR